MYEFNSFIQNLIVANQGFHDGFEKLQKSLLDATDNILNKFKSQLPGTLEEFKRILESLEYVQRLGLAELSQIGWYPSLEMPVSGLYSAIEEKIEENIEVIDDEMSDYYHSNFDILKQSILDRYPNRKRLLNNAFWAHENERWALSIPVFICQADGIGTELFSCSMFSKRNNKLRIKCKIDELEDQCPHAESLRHVGAFSKNTADMRPGDVNRHAIIHGIDCEYDTKTNSFKSFSLLNYINEVGKVISPTSK